MTLAAEEACLIGTSDASMLAGLSPWGGPAALFGRIVHGIQPPQTVAQGAGHAGENYNRARYVQATGYGLLGPQKWRHPLYPWLRCSPDDVAVLEEDRRRLVELKLYQWLDGWGAAGSEQVPHDIYLQVQMQAGVGLDCGYVEDASVDVSALLRGEHRLYSVPHVPEVYERAVAMCERFWRDFIIPRRFPDDSRTELLERDVYALRALFPAPVADEPMGWPDLAEDEQRLVLRWLEANRARKAWAAQEEALAHRVAMLLREVPQLVGLPDGGRVDFKATKPSPRLDVNALRVAAHALKDENERQLVLGLLKQCTKHESTRPLVARGVGKE